MRCRWRLRGRSPMRCSWRRNRTQPGAPRTRSRPRWRPGREAPPPCVVALGTASASWFQAPGPLASLRGAGPHHRCTPCGTTLRSWCRPRKATSPDGSCAWRPVCSEKAAFLHPLPQGGFYRRDCCLACPWPRPSLEVTCATYLGGLYDVGERGAAIKIVLAAREVTSVTYRHGHGKPHVLRVRGP